jgi:hypothetical protein
MMMIAQVVLAPAVRCAVAIEQHSTRTPCMRKKPEQHQHLQNVIKEAQVKKSCLSRVATRISYKSTGRSFIHRALCNAQQGQKDKSATQWHRQLLEHGYQTSTTCL